MFKQAFIQRLVVAFSFAFMAITFDTGNHRLHAQVRPPLTTDQALTLAEARSALVKAYELGSRAARSQAIAAEQLPDPNARVGLNNLPVTGSDQFSIARDFMTMRSIGVMQEFTRDDKRRARSNRFEREAEAALAGQLVALANLRRDTLIAWLERHFQERLRALLSAQKDEALLQVSAAESAYRGARGSQADIFAARIGVEQLEDRIRQADRQVQIAQARLMRWIGEDASRPLAPPPPMLDAPIEFDSLDPPMANQRWLDHPVITLLSSQESVAQAEVDLAGANRRADWSVELMYSQRGPAYSNMISINASVPLQWDQGRRQDQELAAKRALLGQAQAQREEASREHLSEVRSFVQQWRSNRDRLAHYERSLLVLASERIRAALAAYRGGTSNLTTVLEARRAEIDLRADHLRLEMETAELWARLNYLQPQKPPLRVTMHTTPALEP